LSRRVDAKIIAAEYDLGCLPERGDPMARTPKWQQNAPHDVGTLWTMHWLKRSARCALLAWPGSWELRVLVDGEIILSERCSRADESFELADRWKHRMIAQGWKQVVPDLAGRSQLAGRPTA
jgi:hypothetical protein